MKIFFRYESYVFDLCKLVTCQTGFEQGIGWYVLMTFSNRATVRIPCEIETAEALIDQMELAVKDARDE